MGAMAAKRRAAPNRRTFRERLLQKKRGFCVNRANFALLLLCFIAIPGQFNARIALKRERSDAISRRIEREWR